jgi:hypothetical chaperone protein
MLAIGLDFGTTNSAIAGVGPGGEAPVLVDLGGATTFRSLLYFDSEERGPDRRPLCHAGAAAIDAYLAGDGTGRLIQSMKSYLSSRLFRATQVFTHVYTLEDLIALVARALRTAAKERFGELPARIVCGRPVRFAGGEARPGPPAEGRSPLEDEDFTGGDVDYALDRLRTALAKAGFDDVVFEYEPVGAAYHYESTLDHDELVLIADFGGGTSDFCLIRVGPTVRARGRTAADILGTDGVALAGDAFDSRILRHVVAPALGRGSRYVRDGKTMPVPPWLHSHLERWHHLSFLKSRETMSLLETIHEGAERPDQIAAFIHVVENDLGYHLYRAVERTKIALSSADAAPFRFVDDPISIERTVTRAEFEQWIEPHTTAIAGCVDGLLARAGVSARDVDRVFATGGSSLVPAVRRLFDERFGREKVAGGDELTSVARGLALRARDLR